MMMVSWGHRNVVTLKYDSTRNFHHQIDSIIMPDYHSIFFLVLSILCFQISMGFSQAIRHWHVNKVSYLILETVALDWMVDIKESDRGFRNFPCLGYSILYTWLILTWELPYNWLSIIFYTNKNWRKLYGATKPVRLHVDCFNSLYFVFILYFVCFTFLQQAKEIFRSYFDTGAVDRINFDIEIVDGLKACKCSKDGVFMHVLLLVGPCCKAHQVGNGVTRSTGFVWSKLICDVKPPCKQSLLTSTRNESFFFNRGVKRGSSRGMMPNHYLP